jgi:tetratricopeptide (TPR) repeat protein
MRAELLLVQVCEFLDTGDGHYRFHEPSRQLSRLPGVVAVDCALGHHLLPELLEAADVLLLQDFHWDLFPVIERRRAAGRLTVQEANDDYTDVQPWNTRAALWQNRATQDELRQALAAADLVQTSTPVLAERWRRWARRVVVFPNQLTQVPPLPEPPSRPLTVGWAGSVGHYADWYETAPRLERWFEAHPGVRLEVMTGEEARDFIRLPPERYRFTPGGSLADYFAFLARLDIGLAPLLPTPFNRGRSDVKYLEYAAHGVAGIYADLEPYRDSIRHGETGLLFKTGDELLGCLDRFVSDAALRMHIRAQAHDFVRRHRLLSDHVGERLEVYRASLPQPARGAVLGEHVLAAAVCDGRYLQLRPGQAEEALAGALREPPTAAIHGLRRLQEQWPRWVEPRQQLGRLFNDQREFPAAQVVLEGALALDVTNATTLAELARAHAGLGDADAARRELERAIAANPYHLVAWQWLLRLLTRQRGPEAAAWAERARRLYPANILLALQGVRVYADGDCIAALHRLVQAVAPTLKPDERPAAATAFAATMVELGGGRLGTMSAAALLERLVAEFPESARLAGLLGQALLQAGRCADALRPLALALQLQRAKLTEHEAAGGRSILQEQIAEHIVAMREGQGA